MAKSHWITEEASRLLSAVQKEEIEEVIRIIINSTQETLSDVINYKHGRYGVSVVQVAAFKNNRQIVEILLENECRCNIPDLLGRTALHSAAANGSAEIISLLIKKGVPINIQLRVSSSKGPIQLLPDDLIPIPTKWGRTALHLATSGLHWECVKLLLDGGADLNVRDDAGLTPLLTTAENVQSNYDENLKAYENVVVVMLGWEVDVNVKNIITGKSPFHQALEFKSLKICEALINFGFDITQVDDFGDTVLHVACTKSNEDVTKLIINHSHGLKLINLRNRKGETPLHCAAYSGSRQCLTLLLNHGGDLSQITNSGLSVSDLIFSYVPRPLSFIIETLNSKIIPNEYSINEREFNVTLDFGILLPNNNRQMSVISSLINSMTSEQKSKFILHPLIEIFLRSKWKRLRTFFFFLVVIYLFFAVSLSIYITFLINNSTNSYMDASRLVLLVTSAIITLHVILQATLAPKYFFREYETWLTISSVSLTFTIVAWEIYGVRKELNVPDWIRHLASYDVLISWTQLMFILGRFPLIGYFALMFFTVLKNVIKVLLFFACLVIGFSLSFCVQFDDMQFTDPWKAFVRTTIMLMGEYEYTRLFDAEKPNVRFVGVSGSLFITSRFIFLLFVFLGSIVLMNLMTGLAVSDLQALKDDGNASHMIKQAQFIAQVEKLLSKKKLQSKCIPQKIKKFFSERNKLPNIVTLNPNGKEKICEVKYRTKSKTVPFKLMENIVLIAIKNQKELLRKQSNVLLLADGINNLRNEVTDNEIVKVLTEIQKELKLLSPKRRS